MLRVEKRELKKETPCFSSQAMESRLKCQKVKEPEVMLVLRKLVFLNLFFHPETSIRH